MRSVHARIIVGLAVTTMLSLVLEPAVVRAAEDDDPLRKEILALNDVTGDKPMLGEVKALYDNRGHARKLIAEAVKMSKEQDQPLNYNGALILAEAARLLKEWQAATRFYQVCAEQAVLLQSEQKLRQAYFGRLRIIAAVYDNKKYEASAKLAKQFIEDLEHEKVGPEFTAEVMRHMVKALAKQGKMDEAMRLVENMVKANEDSWQNLDLKAWLFKEKKQYDEAVKAYQRALQLVGKEEVKDSDDEGKVRKELIEDQLQTDLIGIFTKQGKVEEANRTIDNIYKPKDNDWRNAYLKADVQQETGHPAAAAKIYEELLERIPKDSSVKQPQKDELLSRIRYILSGVYIDMDRLDKATDQLKTLLAAEPDSPRYNNDLGYIMADHDKSLDEAEKMIRKALDEDRKDRKKRQSDFNTDEDKDNAAYLDSLGWVLFKKKNYKEAKKYLLDAVQDPDGQHIEIMDHLADVHLALGEKADAVATWKKALKVETNSLREKQKKVEVEKKLKANQ
ncbi:MAG TPA: tetratricopeptide repeat protein [Gemmataceae bacterium]|nr:tetratricopeptide repeat protein [Gemmataceae bacterium]